MQATYEQDPKKARIILDALDATFPELTTDEEMNGGDTVDVLVEWRAWLDEDIDEAERRAAAATQRGSIHLTLLAFQLAVAIGIGFGVLSILEWAQAALGGVL